MVIASHLTVSKALNFGTVAVTRSLNIQLKYPSKGFIRSIQMVNIPGFKSTSSSCSRGALIVLGGLDRCGKTTQSSSLHKYLEGLGHSVELWRYPDRATSVVKMISSYLFNESQLDDHAIHLLFSANRWEKRSLMESKLKSGTTTIVDRYSYSGVAFSSAKGLDFEWCKAPEKGLLAPDLVVYLDIPPEKAAERGGYGGERYEQLEFQKKVRQCYKALHDASWKQAKWGTIEQIDRSILWKEARKDSSGNYVTERDKVMGEAIEDMLEQIKEGKLIEIGTNDILTQVLGTAEHLDRVRGQSRGVTQRDYFHKPVGGGGGGLRFARVTLEIIEFLEWMGHR